MTISIFDLFSIGIGPSSSHTVGPMKAAYNFVHALQTQSLLPKTAKVIIELYGSLALTGKGHGTDTAILNGLEGKWPATVDPDNLVPRAQEIINTETINLLETHSISFIPAIHLIFHGKDLLPLHTNGMRFTAIDKQENILLTQVFYSIGGGFIITPEDITKPHVETSIPYPFASVEELLALGQTHNLSIADIMLANEKALRPHENIENKILEISQIMKQCIEKGCNTEGILPGGLKVKRRASDLYKKMQSQNLPKTDRHSDLAPWLNIYAIAVNEENAAGGRIVTAPTNGAAGIIPAVLNYYLNFYEGASDNAIVKFLLTAGAIALLCKKNASISGAEVGCQGEVGSASAMAAAGLTSVLGGTNEQIENAAEIALEHHLGMTCDPIGGLVQIPCIERNAMGSVKAVNAARLALMGDGHHYVSLDKAIATMRQTGKDMMTIYKETSLGGLAANIAEC